MPELTTKGKVIYVNWNKPVYLGGLQSSSVSYEMYKKDHRETLNLYNEYDCSAVHTYCNITVPYSDLLIGGKAHFYVSLNIKEPMKMCQEYHSAPLTITSKQSSIDLAKIVGE